MVKETKFYKLLDVDPSVSEADLKKAYRKKALRLHPDKGGDPEQFKEVTHAYEVLSDPNKRATYDAHGEAGLEGQGGMSGMDPQDLFSQLFGGGMFGGGGGGRSQQRRTKDLVHRVHVSLEELYRGKTSKLALTRNILCSKCNGKGGKEGAMRSCNGCGGRGVKMQLRQMGPMIQQIQSPCDECNGTGEIINAKDRCTQCKGKKVVPDKKLIEVHIDKGMKGGQHLTFSGESDQAPGAVTGDVVIVIEEKPHEVFKRQGNDLIAELEVDLLTALGGGSLSIPHLDARRLVITLVPGEVIKNDDLKVIHGQGMPSQRHHEPGDLYIKFRVNFPESISPDVIEHLERALPARTPIPKPTKGVTDDEVYLSDVDPRQRTAAMEDEDMDDGSGRGGGPGVQCANQ